MSTRPVSARPHLTHLPSSAAARRRRRKRLLLPLLVALVGVILVAVGLAFTGGDDRIKVGTRYAAAFAKGDYASMYAMISASDRRTLTVDRFTTLQQEARTTATVQKITTGLVTKADTDRVRVPVSVKTALFGTLNGDLYLPIVKDGKVTDIDWSQALAFPGLRQGEQLRRTTTLPTRASIISAGGITLVHGADRIPVADTALNSIVGQVGPIPESQKETYAAQGVPAGALVGLTGLERVFDARLRGTPGGTLYAGNRELATIKAEAATPVHTTIEPKVQRAAVAALAGRIGGIAVVKPSTGAILALAGSAFSGLQPPGSTFKMITATAALRYKAATLSTQFPIETAATIEGVEIQNSDGESCGGTLLHAFEVSCNSVFAPLGVKVGATKLVSTAEDFGFNADLGIPGAQTSVIPPANQIGDDLAIGSSSIGQGRVVATALQMSLVAATIAERGMRPQLTLESAQTAKLKRVIPRTVASQMTTMMAGVVVNGTGTLAKIPGVQVAGKTGTAELKTTQGTCDTENPPAGGCPVEDDKSDTTAWFAGFAPAGSPKIAIAVQLPGQGKGGDSAAPAFASVGAAALGK